MRFIELEYNFLCSEVMVLKNCHVEAKLMCNHCTSDIVQDTEACKSLFFPILKAVGGVEDTLTQLFVKAPCDYITLH